MKFTRTAALLFAIWSGALPAIRAQHVKASLVADVSAIQAGHPFTVALHFIHDPHWHTYWVNPGTGLATSLTWKLPAGFSAGEIQWPAPTVLKDRTDTVIGNGYDGDLLLPVTITPPAALAADAKIKLQAEAQWLMCQDVCMPGNADVTLELPVTAGAASPDPAWSGPIARTLHDLPRSDPAWKISAAHDAKNVVLNLVRVGAESTSPKNLHFFSADNFVAYELPQSIAGDGHGGFTLTMPISPDGPTNPAKLTGVVTSENGWDVGGALKGLAVDTIFGAPTNANATTGSVATGGTIPGGGVGANSAGSATAAAGGFGLTLVLAFVGGLILNLMPCVFPVLGIKILGFVNRAGHERGKIVAHGLVFALGVLLSFWGLAAALAILRAGGSHLGWGFQLQSPAFVFVLASVMLIFALNMSGVFEFALRATSVGGELQTRSGLGGSFCTGVLATVVATPCSAPFLAPALGAALTLSLVQSFTIFTAIAVGLALPYLLLSLFPGAVKILPRPGAWMETFKQFMAFPLYATVGYLAWVLAGQTSEEGFQNVLFGLVLVAMAVWLYGRWTTPGSSPGRVRFGVGGLVVLLVAGAWLGWPASLARAKTAPGAIGNTGEIVWDKWSPEAVEKLRSEGKIVYVDFTARWCATCQANKKLVFHSDDVLKTFADKKVVTLRGDWTNQDPDITAELAKYNRSAVPFNQVWLPGKSTPELLPELLTPNIVLNAVNAKS